MEFKEMYRVEMYEVADGFVACAIQKSNDYLAGSTRPYATAESAKVAVISMMRRKSKPQR